MDKVKYISINKLVRYPNELGKLFCDRIFASKWGIKISVFPENESDSSDIDKLPINAMVSSKSLTIEAEKVPNEDEGKWIIYQWCHYDSKAVIMKVICFFMSYRVTNSLYLFYASIILLWNRDHYVTVMLICL